MKGINTIKKAGIKEHNKKIFKETQKMCEQDSELSIAIIKSQYGTQFFSSDQVKNWNFEREKMSPSFGKTKVSFSRDKSFTAAEKFAKEVKSVAVLNFANAGTPGGGVTTGAIAQEEDLCRSSILYPVLSSRFGIMPQYYKDGLKQREKKEPMNAGIMYNPGIIVFRSDSDNYRIYEKNERFATNIITCAAPDLRYVKNFSEEDQRLFHLEKGRVIMDLALQNHDEVIILGAFGCGAFRNDPEIVAKVYRELVREYDGFFKEIHFAIYGKGNAKRNYGIFVNVFD